LAVDARDLASDTRGIGRYTRAILRRLAERSDIHLTLLVFGPLAGLRRAKLRATLGSDRFAVSSRPGRCDVLWSPANGTFFSGHGRSVVTIHDTVPFRFPDPDRKRRDHQQAPFLRSVRTAERIIAVSYFDRDEVVEVFALAPDRIDVIYHGVDPFFSPGTPEGIEPQLHSPYFLFVGDPLGEPRKNFQLLYEAYRRAFDGPAPPLVVVGPTDPNLTGVYYAGLAAGDAAGSGDVRLRSLYRGALALCIPSYYETFGMPLAEAMACGTPTLASRASCLPEIGGDAALYAPPHDVQSWSDALSRIAQDASLREKLRAAGIARAKEYSWDESARRHAEVFFRS
jgi:glycosyltransferase involved in cell wall biosynthesis